VGGSGTRVVEKIMRQLHVYTGADLNTAGDNRWFTLLCKLPRWAMDDGTPQSPAMRSLATLEMAMTGRLEFTPADRKLVEDALRRSRHWWRRDRLLDDRPPAWLRARVGTLLRSGPDDAAGSSMWGWKEPNSHFFIRHLHAHFGDRLRYVHVIRNGFHMAQSRNQLQLRRWGSYLGVSDGTPTPSPVASLDFWIRANEAAIAEGNALPQGAFFLLNYDDLCANPRDEITRFVEFLNLSPPERVLRELVSLPQSRTGPPDAERALETVFGAERLRRVRALGYPAEHAR
jgi:Sulfotransferase family